MKKTEVDQQPTAKDMEIEWKIKRSSRITASGISKLMMGGRSKAEVFGKTAIEYLDDIIFQIREQDLVDEVDAWQMKFGKDNEILAIDWIRRNFMEEIKHGAMDFGGILFMCVGDHFGDSPDGLVYNDDELIAWLEVKCPANKKKACNLTLPTVTLSDVIDEYKWQFVGHFIGNPNVDQGWYVIYNAHINELTGKAYDRGVRLIVERKDLQSDIDFAEAKIEKAYEFIKLCLKGEWKVEQINEWWAIEG